MTVTTRLHYHPFSRAAGVVWMLEEVGIDYDLCFVDMFTGEHKKPDLVALNPMGKLPILEDADVVVTESAAIGLYLADRYAAGRLAPALDDAARGTYLRWSLFAPSVIEPGAMAKASGATFKESSAGWGNYDTMLDAMEFAIADKTYILGDTFSMADVIFGGTLGFMLQFELVERRPSFVDYSKRLQAREAHRRADQKNAAMIEEKGLGK